MTQGKPKRNHTPRMMSKWVLGLPGNSSVCFETGFLCETALVVLELASQTRLASTQRSLLSAGIKSMCHYTNPGVPFWLLLLLFCVESLCPYQMRSAWALTALALLAFPFLPQIYFLAGLRHPGLPMQYNFTMPRGAEMYREELQGVLPVSWWNLGFSYLSI